MERRYQFLSRISSGGMGEVFLAESSGEHGFRKRIAVKRILPELAKDATFVDRFVSEAKLAVSLSHANLVQVFDLARSADELFLAMEYVEGADLRRLLTLTAQRGLQVPVEIAVHLGMKALEGLAFAHERTDDTGRSIGVVHCDISPANLLVSNAGELKIADFGVAQVLSVARRRRSDGRVVGKLRYMAPEMIRGDALDPRTDLYSLTLVLSEALTLRAVFERDTPEATMSAILEGQSLPLAELRPDIPAELGAILARAAHVDPARRPSSARAMLAELTTVSRNIPPVTAPDVGTWARSLLGPTAAAPARGLEGAFRQLLREGDVPRTDTASNAPPARESPAQVPLRALTFVSRPAADGTSVWVPVAVGSSARRAWRLAGLAAVTALAAVGGTLAARRNAPAPAPAPAPTLPAPVEEAAAPVALQPVLRTDAGIVSAPKARPTARVGFVSFSAVPWAYVSVDGKRLGETPLVGVAVPTGSHRVRFEKPHSPTVERTIQVSSRQSQLVDAEMTSGP